MITPARIVATLKQQLKLRGITYKALAERLQLSESAIKNMFATGNLSLKRLDELCEVLELDIGELVSIADVHEPRLEELSVEQEQELVTDNRLLLVVYCLVNYWSVDEIVERYEITEKDYRSILLRLNRLALIELQPNDRVRLLISSNFRWRKNGPIERFFRSRVQEEFFNADFTEDGAIRVVKNGMLSKKAQIELVDRLRSIGEQFDDVARDERKLPARQRQGTTMVLAIRNWFFAGFRELER